MWDEKYKIILIIKRYTLSTHIFGCCRWFIDGIPIRIFRNYESIGVPYPKQQAMKLYSSIWNADNWATRGGLEKIDWNSAPFIARYRQLNLRACEWTGLSSTYECASTTPSNWWASSEYSHLSYSQIGQMEWVRNNYMIYDYCKDTKRFSDQLPVECYGQQYWHASNDTMHQNLKKIGPFLWKLKDNVCCDVYLILMHMRVSSYLRLE